MFKKIKLDKAVQKIKSNNNRNNNSSNNICKILNSNNNQLKNQLNYKINKMSYNYLINIQCMN